MHSNGRSLFIAAIALTILWLAEPTTWAQRSEKELAQLFQSKPITIIVGSSPGGGYDTFARIAARFIGPYLPGNPSFIVNNVPGAGQLRGLRRTMKSTPDGLTIGLLHPRFVQRELAGIDVPDFDLKTVKVIGSPSAVSVQRLWCVRRSIASNWEEVKKLGRALTNGSAGRGASFGLGPEFVQSLGGPIKMVYGYGGTSEIMAAFDRGELDSVDRCTSENVPRLFPNWITDRTVAPVFWWENKPSADWLGQLGATNVPYLLDIVDATPEQKKAFEVAVSFNIFNRIFVAPPGTPDDGYAAWTTAFEKMISDPGFRKAADAAGLDVGLGTAADFNKTLEAFQELSPEGVKVLVELIGPAS